MGKRSLACLFVLALVGSACASGHCRKPASPQAANPEADKDDPSTHVFVAKADGSVQCSKSKGKAPDEMKPDGIMIYSQSKKHDKLMHPQLCGSPTGMYNIYEIALKDLQAVEKAGFKKWLY